MGEEWLRRLRGREWEAWHEWVHRYSPRIHRIVSRHERRADLREELSAIVLAECVRAILTATPSSDEDLDGLVTRIARCRCLDWVRNEARRRRHLESEVCEAPGAARAASARSSAGGPLPPAPRARPASPSPSRRR